VSNPLLEPSDEATEVRSYFVRGRNALVTRADFGSLFVDHYLHLAETGQRFEATADQLLKESLAALVLHCASRPWNEAFAWTLHFEAPLMNVFVSGDNNFGTVTGTVFENDIRETGRNLFYCDAVIGRQSPRRSVIDFEGTDALRAAEVFHRQSEQRTGRYFHHGEEDLVLITAQPDCDEAWLEGLSDETVRTMDQTETLSLLEKRYYRWQCGCSQERILQLLAPEVAKDPTAIFEKEASVRVQCPRCGRRHLITREAVEAHLAGKAG